MITTLIKDQQDMEMFFSQIHQDFRDVRYVGILQGIVADLETLHAQYFVSNTDPVGKPWPPLAASTVRAKGHDTILVDTGKLRASLIGKTGDSIREVFVEGETHGLMFGTDLEYAHYHLTGTNRMPARPEVGISNEVMDAMTGRMLDFAIEELKE